MPSLHKIECKQALPSIVHLKVYGMNPYVPIGLIALPKDEFIHKKARKHDAAMIKLHKQVRATIER